jgi:hypothetical protein
MRLRDKFFLVVIAMLPQACPAGTFAVIGMRATSWPAILSSVGHVPGPIASADIVVAPANTPASADWRARVKGGTALILEGPSPLAAAFGFKPGAETVPVIHLEQIARDSEDGDPHRCARVCEGPLVRTAARRGL